MRNLHMVLALALSITLAGCSACGNDEGDPDASIDGNMTLPEAPRLGTQIERVGRPTINTLLIGLLDATDVAAAKRDAYNAASDPETWAAAEVAGGRSIVAEIAANLAIIDVLDQGNNMIPNTPTGVQPGCSNQVLFNGNPSGGGTPAVASYRELATILADDMIYVDPKETMCPKYLTLEFLETSGGDFPQQGCGGRKPTFDVIDASYSWLIAGFAGFAPPPGLAPFIPDGAAVHADVSDGSFPFFGAPR